MEGEGDLLVVSLDDFGLILGIDFLKTIKGVVVPHSGELLIMDHNHPCFVTEVSKEKKAKDVMLLAKQVEQGL